MSIQLPADLETTIRQKVENGLYASADAAILVAIRLLDEHDPKRQCLLAALAEGATGEGIPYTPALLAAIDREVDERFRCGDTPNADVWSQNAGQLFGISRRRFA